MRNASTQEPQPQQSQLQQSQQQFHPKEDKLPEQLFPTFKTPTPTSNSVVIVTTAGMSTELKTAETATMIKSGSSSAASSSSSSLPSGPPKLSSFRSSLTGASLASFAAPALLPLASLPLPAPMAPLLSRGAGHSSAHLGLVAMDPESSVLSKDALNRLKLAFIKGGSCTPNTSRSASTASASSSSTASVPTPPTAPGQRKRRSSRLSTASKERAAEASVDACKKQKVLPLVPQQSLLTLEKQLSRGSGAEADGDEKAAAASPVETELAAFALARHLVDWASSFDLDGADSNEEDAEEEEQAAQTATTAAAVPMLQHAPHTLPAEWLSAVPQFFEEPLGRGESGRALDGQGDFQSFQGSSSATPDHGQGQEQDQDQDFGAADEFASTASTPSFEPHMDREDSQASVGGATAVAADDEPAQASYAQLAGRHAHEDLMQEEEEQQAHAAMDSATRLSIQLSPLLSPHSQPLMSLHMHMHMPLHLLSPLASPKVSPSLLAHLASPSERAGMLGAAFSLDDLPSAPQLLQPSPDSPLLAHTTTSAGAHVSLIQHNAPHTQMAW